MGQILDRIFRIAKSYSNDSDLSRATKTINQDSNELKKLIEELNKQKKESNSKKEQTSSNSKKQSETKANSGVMTLDAAYKVLELSKNSSIDDIKAAYKNKIKEYHPDKVNSLGKEIQELAQRKTQDINEAYSILRKALNF